MNGRRWAAVLVAFAPCVACSSSSSPGGAGTSSDAGLDADQPEAPLSCLLDAGTCPSGCNAISGALVDLARKCRAGAAAIGCLRDGVKPNLAVGCIQQTLLDGGVETFVTTSLFGASTFGPGFTDCTDAVQSEAFRISGTCP